MAKCPFAVWLPLPGSAGEYVDDHPFKIVHHTTEGSTASCSTTRSGSACLMTDRMAASRSIPPWRML